MLTRAELAAIRAILETRLGWQHPLTQAVHQAIEAMPVETSDDNDRKEQGPWPDASPESSSHST